MHCWSSLQESRCEKDSCRLTVTPCDSWIEWIGWVCLSHWHLLLRDPLIREPIVMALFLEVWIRECGFDSAIHTYPQSSQIRVYIVQYLLKRAWIRTILVVLIRMKTWAIAKLAMDHCSLKELVTLQHASFSPLSEQVKQLALRNVCSKHLTKWELKWQLYLNKLDRVRTVPLGVALPYCLYHVKEETAMWQLKMSPPGHNNRRYSLSVTISAGPAGFYGSGNIGAGWGYILEPVQSGAEHFHMPAPRPPDARSPLWARLMASEGWPSQCYTPR